MAKQLVIFSAICSVWLLLLDGANCTGSMHAKENHNYSTAEQQQQQGEQRVRRDVAEPQQVEQQQFSVTAAVPVNIEEAEANNNDNKNVLQTNFGSLQSLNIVKRAPSGFTGMRGKKEYEFPDFTNNPLYWDNINPIEQQQQREEDSSSTEDESDIWGLVNGRRYKKTPTAFYGVRGKKYTGNDYMRLNAMLRKLEEEQIRESVLENFLDRLATTELQQNEISKRAPIGFTGMRGKRPAVDDNGIYASDTDTDMEKRGPVNAFVGVRGKKDVDHQNFKRSPATESYNRRGKNQRFVDFSNKFVAVRGKKNFAAASNAFENAVAAADAVDDDETIENTKRQEIKPARARFYVNILPSLLYSMNDKRTPSGFLGMRGKRDANVAYSADNNKLHKRGAQ